MEGAIFHCPGQWAQWLPPGTVRLETPEALARRRWPLLVLTPEGWGRLGNCPAACRILLAPGDCPAAVLARLGAEAVVTYGLSPRDSLTLSSLTEPVLCVQRALPRPDGGEVEPQEFPLPPLPGPAAGMLPLLGLRLLQMPLADLGLSW